MRVSLNCETLRASHAILYPTVASYTVRAYTRPMRVSWDSAKARENLRKHGVDFADAAVALEDVYALTAKDEDHAEQRFKTLCMDPYLNVLLVVHAYREQDEIRLISARKANRVERIRYSERV